MASREASVVTGEPGGFEVSIGSSNQYNAQKIVDGLFEAAAVLDEPVSYTHLTLPTILLV